jgi:hypothetical protein
VLLHCVVCHTVLSHCLNTVTWYRVGGIEV